MTVPLPADFATIRARLFGLLDKLGDLAALRDAVEYAATLHETCDRLEGRARDLQRQGHDLAQAIEERQTMLQNVQRDVAEEIRRLRGELQGLNDLRTETLREHEAEGERLRQRMDDERTTLRSLQAEVQAEHERLARVRAEARRALADLGS